MTLQNLDSRLVVMQRVVLRFFVFPQAFVGIVVAFGHIGELAIQSLELTVQLRERCVQLNHGGCHRAKQAQQYDDYAYDGPFIHR